MSDPMHTHSALLQALATSRSEGCQPCSRVAQPNFPYAIPGGQAALVDASLEGFACSDGGRETSLLPRLGML